MTVPKRLTLFVEGPGDSEAAPSLVTRLLADHGATDCFFTGPPFMAGDVMDLLLGKNPRLKDYLGAAAKKRDLGAVLVLLDGDTRLPANAPFCPGTLARRMAAVAREARAGEAFSFAAVFAMREYESWFLGGIEALAGRPLSPGNLPGVRADATPPSGDLEQHPRDAKGAVSQRMISGPYKETTHQALLTRVLVENLEPLRRRGMRSFRQLETSLKVLADAARAGKHISIPPSTTSD